MERERDKKPLPPIPPQGNNKSANVVGVAIVFLGVILLMRNLDLGFPFPKNIFGWEMILILIGLVIGINSKFEKKSSITLIVIGGLFFFRRLLNLSFGGVVMPVLAIIVGIYFIVRNRRQPSRPTPLHKSTDRAMDEFDWDKRVDLTDSPAIGYDRPPVMAAETDSAANTPTKQTHSYEGENYIQVESIFGHARKVIFSKNFLGGTMTNLFGSTELNLLQADIRQPIALDIFQLFGSSKIIVPPHWIVATNASNILSENDDRRAILPNVSDPSKCLYITGTSIFGNITIKTANVT